MARIIFSVARSREDLLERYIKKMFKYGEGGRGVGALRKVIANLQLTLIKPEKISLKGKEVPEIRELINARLAKPIKIAEKMVKNDPEKHLCILGYPAQVLNSACDPKLHVDYLANRIKTLEEPIGSLEELEPRPESEPEGGKG